MSNPSAVEEMSKRIREAAFTDEGISAPRQQKVRAEIDEPCRFRWVRSAIAKAPKTSYLG
jgi:hypothetical protein